ncbi:MAG TPA: hypothetical protein PLM98_13275, partial [Thiolinea sp.]|nr:hypothetical protein [Thiolinea sp.]
MDRVTQRRKKGNRLIGQRYLLQTTVVSNSAGTLYQARDMRAGAAQDAQVIIHVLPPNALRSIPLKLLTERIQALSQKADSAVLKLLDSGWTNTEPYFVLASPATWSVSALPAMLGQSTRLHQQALQLNQRLTEQGLIKGALPTSLFLVSADGQIYLPSTALVLSLHNLVESPDLLLQAHRLPTHTRFKALPFLGLGFIGVVAASGAGFYYQNYLTNSQALLEESTKAARTTSLLEPATLNELPVVQSPTLNSSSLADTPSLKPEPEKFDDNRVLANSRSSSSAQPIPEEAQSLATTPQLNNTVISTQILPDPEPGDMRVALAGEQAKSPMTP